MIISFCPSALVLYLKIRSFCNACRGIPLHNDRRSCCLVKVWVQVVVSSRSDDGPLFVRSGSNEGRVSHPRGGRCQTQKVTAAGSYVIYELRKNSPVRCIKISHTVTSSKLNLNLKMFALSRCPAPPQKNKQTNKQTNKQKKKKNKNTHTKILKQNKRCHTVNVGKAKCVWSQCQCMFSVTKLL